MKKLLFVDDEQPVLEFLRLSLRTLAGEWEMEFVQSAEQALRSLARGPVDVVLTDIHLNGNSGIQLLQDVKPGYPHTVRSAFSGAAGQDVVVQALRVAHQVLPKPLTPGMLRASLARACALRDQVANEAVECLVGGMRHLPTLPTLYEELLGVLQDQDSSADAVAKVIAKDSGMNASLLRLANSAYFHYRTPVTTASQAVALLGIENVKSLVLGYKAHHGSSTGPTKPSDSEGIWRHGFSVAAHARAIASLEDVGSVGIENAFLAGLLHDVGRAVLLINLPEEYDAAVRLVDAQRITLSQAEREILGASHAQVGAYLLGKWGLRDTIVEAVAFHHEPMRCFHSGFSILAAIHVANAFDREGPHLQADPPVLDEGYLCQVGLASHLPHWRSALAA